MMLRGIFALSALSLVVWATDARAGGCAGCGTVLASAQASEQVWAAPQGDCGAPVAYTACEAAKPSCFAGLGCKIKGIGSGIGCGLSDMKAGLGCKMAGLGHGLKGLGCDMKSKLGGLGHGLKCHAATTCVAAAPCNYVTPSPQFASEQVPSGQYAPVSMPAGQYPSGQ